MKSLFLSFSICGILFNSNAGAQNNWTQKANVGSIGRLTATCFTIGSKAYVGTGSPLVGSEFDDLWEYDPATDVWTQKANMGGGGRYNAFGFSIGTKGYIGTGIGAGAVHKYDFWEYDQASNTWTQKANFGGGTRAGALGFAVGTKGYAGNGLLTGVGFVNDMFVYDPSTNTWSPGITMGAPAGRINGVSFSVGGKGYAGMGMNQQSSYQNDFWEFNPLTNSWIQKATFPGGARSGASGFGIGDKAYIGMGLAPNPKNDLWEFNILTNSWQQKANLPAASRYDAVGFSIGSKGYIATGTDNTIALTELWEYTPCSYPAAVITAGGPVTFCNGGNVVLNANTGAGLLYQWKKNGVDIAGATNSSYTATTPGSYLCIVSATATCSTTSNTISVTVNSNPSSVITPAGPLTFCSGGSVVLNANTGTGLTYQWKLDGLTITGATTSSYTAVASGSYTVVVTNSNNCSSTSAAKIVTVNPLPTVSFSGLASSYNVSAPAATLTGSPLGGTFSGPGISGNTFTPSVAGVGGPYTIIYSYTDANNCSNSSSQQTTVTSCTVPAQPGTITVTGGIAKICPGDSRTYTIAAVSGATSYTWTPPTGASISSGQGNTSVIINYTAGFTVSGTLGVVANSACGSSIAKTLTISRNNPSTPGVISGAASAVCAGTTGAYSVVNVAGITYNWTAPANASIASGQGTNSVTVSFSASFTTGTLKVTAANNCGTSGARTLSILSKPATPSVISGASNTVCAGTTGTYTVTNVSGVTYNWTAPANASIASGQGTNSVSVSFSALFTSGSLTVSGSNACGTSALRSLSISSKPAKPGTITGPGYGNCNATATYSIVAVAYATSYTWTTNIAGAVVTPNGTSASISFPAFTSGTVSVTANNVCGSSTARTLTVKGTPATPASITGPTMVCANQFGVPYSIAAIPTATSYTWTGMTGSHISDGVVTSGGTTLTTTSTSVTVNFGSTSGNLNVKANNACGAGTNKTLTIGFNCREDEVVTEDNFDVKVFPNPSSGDFVFEISNAANEKISINIYDVIGKLVLSEAIQNSQFTIRDPKLIPGIYSAEIISGKNKKVLKLVKTE